MMPSVTYLRLSDVSIICRVTYFSFQFSLLFFHVGQLLPGPALNNVLRVLQVSFQSVHFQWSYSRKCEHCQIAP